MAKKQYDDATKAAVMAALLAGQLPSQIAGQFNVPVSTIRNWKSATRLENVIDHEEKYEIGDMLLAYLREILNALRKQAVHFGKESWLNNQNAADLAVLHGVAADKALRIIEALAGGSDSEAGE